MSDDLAVAFQAAIAGRLDDIPEAMSASHDALIQQHGKRRRSGISWWIFGPPLSGVAAQRRGHGRYAAPTGTLEDGWARLTEMLDNGAMQVADDYLETMKAWAADFANPTLVIATCDIRPPKPWELN